MEKIKWPRYDPQRGYMLCEYCWNYRHFSYGKAYIHVQDGDMRLPLHSSQPAQT
jgi:hypothetical protein